MRKELARGPVLSHPMVRWVRRLPGNFMLQREVADALGVSPSLLPYMATRHPEETLGPSHRAQYGKVELMLYSPERVEQIREYLERSGRVYINRPGRTRMFTPVEALDRRRRGARASALRKQASRYDEAERFGEAERLRAKANELMAEQKRLYDIRLAEMTEIARQEAELTRTAKG